MHSLQENDWVPAKVPGSVYQAYLDAGKMDDPFYRDNEEKALNLMKQDFEFATTFDVKEALREADRTVLHFDGIDTLGEIYLNGTHLGDTENMHREWEFDVKELLKAEGNELRVILRSPVNYIYDSYEKDPLSVDCSDAMKGCSRLRKAHCMFGWDWGPRLPDAGIFREVKLLGITKARFDNVRISQKHVDGQVDLAIPIPSTGPPAPPQAAVSMHPMMRTAVMFITGMYGMETSRSQSSGNSISAISPSLVSSPSRP